MVDVDVVLRLDQEAPLRLLLDLGEPAGTGTDQDARHLRRELDAERLRLRPGCEYTQPPLDLDGRGRLGHDDPVAPAGGALLRQRVLEPGPGALRARAHEAAGVYVDDRERLGVVEDEVAAGWEIDAARERGANLGVDPGCLEERRLVLVAHDPLDHVRRGLL